jgi:hypothetical protein
MSLVKTQLLVISALDSYHGLTDKIFLAVEPLSLIGEVRID